MPRKKKHVKAGMPAGGCAALVASIGLPPENMIVETLAGLPGGWFGSRLPDLLEPAFHNPNHRSFAHSQTVTVGLGVYAVTWMRDCQRFCRSRAAERRERAANAESIAGTLWNGFLWLLWTAAAGFLAGVVGGYLSHLFLDADTKFGLPAFA